MTPVDRQTINSQIRKLPVQLEEMKNGRNLFLKMTFASLVSVVLAPLAIYFGIKTIVNSYHIYMLEKNPLFKVIGFEKNNFKIVRNEVTGDVQAPSDRESLKKQIAKDLIRGYVIKLFGEEVTTARLTKEERTTYQASNDTDIEQVIERYINPLIKVLKENDITDETKINRALDNMHQGIFDPIMKQYFVMDQKSQEHLFSKSHKFADHSLMYAPDLDKSEKTITLNLDNKTITTTTTSIIKEVFTEGHERTVTRSKDTITINLETGRYTLTQEPIKR